MFYVEIECSAAYNTPKPDWRKMCPTGQAPYEYATREAAERDMQMCYPDCVIAEQVRVTEQ